MALGTDARNASTAARTALVNGGTLRLRAGSTTRGNISLEATAFGSPTAGAATAAGFPKSVVLTGTGNLDNFQALDSSGNVEWDGDITVTGGGGELELPQVNLAAGVEVEVDSWTHSQPA